MRLSPFAKFILALIGTSFLLAFLPWGKWCAVDVPGFRNYLGRFPAGVSEGIFIFLYLFLPKDILRIAGAVIYGAVLSSVLVFIGELLNLVLFFQLSRRLGRPFVERQLKGKMEMVDRIVADTGWGAIFCLRLFPIVAFRVMDLAFGLTRISFGKYFLISVLASPPRIYLIQLVWSLGAGTVMNPVRFSEYLDGHPWLAVVLFSYLFGSVVMLKALRRRPLGRQASGTQDKI